MNNLLRVECHRGNENVEGEVIVIGVIRDSFMKDMPLELSSSCKLPGVPGAEDSRWRNLYELMEGRRRGRALVPGN